MVDTKNKKNSNKSIEKPDKLGKKAIEIINKEEEKKALIKETENMKLFDKIEKFDNIEQLENFLKRTNLVNYCTKFLYNTEKLKTKLLRQENLHENKEITAKLYMQIKKIFLVYYGELTNIKDIKEYLNLLIKLGFQSTASHLRDFLVQKLKIKEIINELNGMSFQITLDNDIYFQMIHLGDFLERTTNSQIDKRVFFQPDLWQKDLLDIVDKRESALICCPTSSGKTFISYYAMEQSLRANNDDMVVFISPMKALANQVAAEVYVRFGNKPYPKTNSKKSVYAMSMPDYTVNDPLSCQILITVPFTFESILSENAEWTKNIKYIIIDEVQVIDETELGASIEKIIHFAQCPILALSATIGNLDKFYEWMTLTQLQKGIKTHKIVQTERYCDLKKFTFVPKLINKTRIDKLPTILPVHELFGYSELNLEENKFSQDFHMLPKEIIELLDALDKISLTKEQKKMVESIKPNKFFKCVLLNKSDVKNYEQFLFVKLQDLYKTNVFSVEEINKVFKIINGECNEAFKEINKVYGENFASKDWMKENIAELVQNLHDCKMLPCIVFLNSAHTCTELALELIVYLESLENENSRLTKSDLKKISTLEKMEKRNKNHKDESKSKKKGSQNLGDEIDDEDIKSFDLNDINEKYTFLDFNYKMTKTEISEEIKLHRYRKNIPKKLFDGWKRGVGVHHAYFHTKFRSSVECLFRRQHLQIVFATKTLSLGLNMPCKTVLLPSDAMFLNTIYYRHMVGRAGRRGFDNYGNIIYYGVPSEKIKNFISSNILKIKGQFSLDLNLILQLSAIKTTNQNSTTIFKSFIENPLLMVTSPNFNSNDCKKTVDLQIEYLLNEKFITDRFLLKKISNVILPMRNEDTCINLIQKLLDDKFFEKLQGSDELKDGSIGYLSEKIILILSHFIHVCFVHEMQAKLIKKFFIKRTILLPEIKCLKEFINSHNEQLTEYTKIGEKDDKTNGFYAKCLSCAFPSYYATLNLAKNSYIYDFYMEGSLNDIDKINNIDETALWYAMKSARAILTAIMKNVSQSKNEIIINAFQECLDRITECFF